MLFSVKFQQNTFSAISQGFSGGPQNGQLCGLPALNITSRTIRISGALIDISYLVYSVKHFQLILL
jgi:hypothetical protein